MNRIFRGAFFPLLIVVLLAFFVTRLLPGSSSGTLVLESAERRTSCS